MQLAVDPSITAPGLCLCERKRIVRAVQLVLRRRKSEASEGHVVAHQGIDRYRRLYTRLRNEIPSSVDSVAFEYTPFGAREECSRVRGVVLACGAYREYDRSRVGKSLVPAHIRMLAGHNANNSAKGDGHRNRELKASIVHFVNGKFGLDLEEWQDGAADAVLVAHAVGWV